MNIYPRILFIVCVALSNVISDTLSGTVTDSLTSEPILNLKVNLECQSQQWVDSVLTDSLGNFTFVGMPTGTYKIYTSSLVYSNKQTLFVWSNVNTTIDFKLIHRSQGTHHRGNVSGVWLPEGNPHWIDSTVKVVGDLNVAPGCVVIARSCSWIQVEANVLIGGSNGSNRTICDSLSFIGTLPQGPYPTVTIRNTDLHHCYFNDHYNLTFDSVYLDGVPACKTGHTFGIGCDTFRIVNSIMFITAGIVLNAHNVFLSYTTLRSTTTGLCIYGATNPINLNIEYCNIPQTIKGIGNSSTSLIKVNHSNIGTLDIALKDSGVSSIKDCIIGILISCPFVQMMPVGYYACDTIFKSIFNSCIFQGVTTPIYGLLVNNQLNANGDSCDTWFNMGKNPMFADTNNFLLSPNSPAIDAASDGSNIGYYQGQGVGVEQFSNKSTRNINHLIISQIFPNIVKIILPFPSRMSLITIYDAKGNKISSIQSLNGAQLVWKPLKLSNGLYFIKVDDGIRQYKGHIIYTK